MIKLLSSRSETERKSKGKKPDREARRNMEEGDFLLLTVYDDNE